MSFFPGSFFTDAPTSGTSYHPLFRLLDDFEQHRSTGTDSRHGSSANNHNSKVMKSFTPKFDVKELTDSYELHGDLPGIEQKDVEIEFTDIQTITVRGRTERSYTSGTPPAGSIEGAAAQGQIEGGDGQQHHHHTAGHKATVEDEDDTATTNAVTTTKHTEQQQQQPKQSEPKYWVSERSVGEFSRSFTFPVRVDQDAVSASMKNGVLSIVVPKAKKHEARKITIA